MDSYYSGNYGLTPYLANALGNYKAALDAAMPWMGGADQQRSSFRMGGGSGNGGSFDSRSDKIEVSQGNTNVTMLLLLLFLLMLWVIVYSLVTFMVVLLMT